MCTKWKEADLIFSARYVCEWHNESPLPRMHICSQSFRNIIYLTHTTSKYFLISINFLESLEQCHFSIAQAVHPHLCNKDVSTAASILLDLSHICTAKSQPRTPALGAQAGRATAGTMTKDQLSISEVRRAGYTWERTRNIYGKSK